MSTEIIRGDARVVLAGMEPESVHAVVTDPPWPDRKIDTGWAGPGWWTEMCDLMEHIVGPEGAKRKLIPYPGRCGIAALCCVSYVSGAAKSGGKASTWPGISFHLSVTSVRGV